MMDARAISRELYVSPQVELDQIPEIAEAGIRSLICNRPDGEGADQPTFDEIAAAAAVHGIEAFYLPISQGRISDTEATEFADALAKLPRPALAYCRSGMRSATLWSLSVAATKSVEDILEASKTAGYDMSGVVRRIANSGRTPSDASDARHDIVIIGGGAAGISVAASLRARKPDADIAIIDPADVHYYQPGWTMVGAGVFDAASTARTMGSLVPRGVHWIKAAVAAFEPERNAVILDGCRVVTYRRLIVCPGIKLDWHGVEGLVDTLGSNGVTSNYRYDLAPYTWKLVQELRSGRALFTQPPMPIKCAGAPQKAMYLSADHWRRNGSLDSIDIEFHTAGGALFGVSDYVPALMEYVNKYRADLNLHSTLVAVDGMAKKAIFNVAKPGETSKSVEINFDFLHVCPPQTAPDFIKVSPLSDASGWVDVDQSTLRHKSYDNIWSLGDVMNAPNAKTAAAARKQAPVVAENVLADIRGKSPVAQYDGYGSCPLTVERGKIVLAEFGYGGTLMPSFPRWLIDGTKPTRAAWLLKEQILPPVYWRAMLRGKEWMAKPETVSAE